MAHDPFLGYDPTEYDINKTYTRSTNKYDHSVTVTVPMQREHQSIMAGFAKDDSLPEYTSVQAFIRDAIFHRIIYLAQNRDDVAMMQHMTSLAMREQINHDDQTRRDELKFVEEQTVDLANLRMVSPAALLAKIYKLRVLLDSGTMSDVAQKDLLQAVESAEKWTESYVGR